MSENDRVHVFGQHEEGTLRQVQDVASRAERAALMADGHVGYVMPIGGVAAYDNKASVVGNGFDIACVAASTPVTTRDGYYLPIERVTGDDAVSCWDGERTRAVEPNLGAVARGTKPTLHVRLANGRTITATADHRVLTRDGWREVGELAVGDAVACAPFVGLSYEEPGELRELPGVGRTETELVRRGLWPLDPRDRRFAPLVRVLGYVSGDGHLLGDGKYASIYTTNEGDAVDVARDLSRLGYRAAIYRRERGDGRKTEINVRVNSVALHALLAALGSPVGRKRWPSKPMRWLMAMPAWVRAQYLSAFASAEMMTPRLHASGVVPNLQLKQAGEDDASIRFVADLCESLGFHVSVAPSGKPYGERRVWVMQILGGEDEQLRFVEEVGFCYARGKREAGARLASVVWQRARHVSAREGAKWEARALHGAGESLRSVIADVSARYDVPEGFVYRAIYDRRGACRRLSGEAASPDVTGEICWEPIESIEPNGPTPVFDVVTADTAHCFFAHGIVVHNCGNAAIRTDVTLQQLVRNPKRAEKDLNALADSIASAISFGIGRKNRADDAPTDHPLFHDPAWDAVPARERKALRDKARGQLGTVGSGNHYVDVFADRETGEIWVGVHFGSRGFGHAVASSFLALGQGMKWGERAPEREVLLDLSDPLGEAYWALMELAGRYAYAGREWVARKVVEIIGANEVELVHNHHNFSWRERVMVTMPDGERVEKELVVVRKGATPAFPGQKGFVGGSMGDDAVILQGSTSSDPETRTLQERALFSTVHGAGRVMSRTQAAGKRNRRTGKQVTPGRISQEMMREWLEEKQVVLRGGGLDESPHVYRRLPEVLSAQGATVEVLHTLRPIIVVMAGADEFDPYKD